MMRNWDFREFRVWDDVPFLIRQERVPIWCVITSIQGYTDPMRQVVGLISQIRKYPAHRSHLHHPSRSVSSTTLPSSQNTKLSHPSLSLHAMIMSLHWVQYTLSAAYTECSIHRVQHTPSAAYTECSIHRVQHTPSAAYTECSIHLVQHTPSRAYTVVQHPPEIVCLPLILMITSWPLNVASASSVPPYTIDRHEAALQESSKVESCCHIPTVAS